eukprot:gnl/MRDRNA2_/MRDRNA2_103676_c0_seq1.p1 gnl/MRDRNA2_/MRDRNA2_103676_c0~~gnl/MRDRNA2_/MRDRNA2_103676_c0_seq1.p1  ORF type:complete len:992 (+),score=224.71 gnl/MRDRNA2_/MRDRNA2_103676_c0_seq1:446-2977(+)
MALPSQWHEYHDENAISYFYNSGTGESTWDHPAKPAVEPFLRFLRSDAGNGESINQSNNGAECLKKAEAEVVWLTGAHELQMSLWQGPFKAAPAEDEDNDSAPTYWYHGGTGESTWGDPISELQSSFQITVKLFDIFCGMCREEMRLADVQAGERLSQAITMIQMRWRGILTRRQTRQKRAQMRDLAEMRRQRAVTDRFLAVRRRLGELLVAVYRGYRQRKLTKLILKQRSALTHRIPLEQKRLDCAFLIQRWWHKYSQVQKARHVKEVIRRFEDDCQLRSQMLALPAPEYHEMPFEEQLCKDPVSAATEDTEAYTLQDSSPGFFLTENAELEEVGAYVPQSIPQEIDQTSFAGGVLTEVVSPEDVAAEEEKAALTIQRHFRKRELQVAQEACGTGEDLEETPVTIAQSTSPLAMSQSFADASPTVQQLINEEEFPQKLEAVQPTSEWRPSPSTPELPVPPRPTLILDEDEEVAGGQKEPRPTMVHDIEEAVCGELYDVVEGSGELDEAFVAPVAVSMTTLQAAEVPGSVAESVYGTGKQSILSGESDQVLRPPPPRPEAPAPKSSWFDKVQGKFAGDWNQDDGYSSASTPSSDLDSEISELDTDEEIAALEEGEREAEAAKAKAEKARERRARRMSQRDSPRKRGSGTRVSNPKSVLPAPPEPVRKAKERPTPTAPAGPKPARPPARKPRAAPPAVSNTPDMSVVSSEGEDGGDERQAQKNNKLSSRLAALSNPVHAPAYSDGKPAYVRPQHRRKAGTDALMQHAKVHQRVLKPLKVLEAVPEQHKLPKVGSADRPRSRNRDQGRPPGLPATVALPQLEPKLPPRYEISKVAMGPPRRRLDL